MKCPGKKLHFFFSVSLKANKNKPYFKAIYLLFWDNILKSRDLNFPTKVHVIKAMVFPVVMYGCENWTVKKAER